MVLAADSAESCQSGDVTAGIRGQLGGRNSGLLFIEEGGDASSLAAALFDRCLQTRRKEQAY